MIDEYRSVPITNVRRDKLAKLAHLIDWRIWIEATACDDLSGSFFDDLGDDTTSEFIATLRRHAPGLPEFIDALDVLTGENAKAARRDEYR